jgi:hypothetical protein
MTQSAITVTQVGSGSPWVNPSDWDSGTIGGVVWGWKYAGQFTQLAGSKLRVVGAKRKYKIEVKDPQGSDGSVQTYRGVKFSPFDLVFFIYTDAQYAYFINNVLPILKFSGFKSATSPANVRSLGVYHPALAAVDIAALLVEEIGAIEPQEDGPNMFECRVRCIEFLPAPATNTTVTPAGAKGVVAVETQPQGARSQRAQAVTNLAFVVGNGG